MLFIIKGTDSEDIPKGKFINFFKFGLVFSLINQLNLN